MYTVRLVRLRHSPRPLMAQVASDARGMRQQHAKCDLCPSRVVVGVEIRQVCLYGFVDPNQALFVQLKKGHTRRERFGQRRQVENRVVGHRFGRCGRPVQSRFIGEFAPPEGLPEHDRAGVPDLHHRAR